MYNGFECVDASLFYESMQMQETAVAYYRLSWFVGDVLREVVSHSARAIDDLSELLKQREVSKGDVHGITIIGYTEESYF